MNIMDPPTVSSVEALTTSNLSSDMLCGFDMSTFPPRNFANATMSWLYMPIIFYSLGLTCSKWSFPEAHLPPRWKNWVEAYQEAFHTVR